MKFFRKLYVWSMNLKLFLSLYFMALIGLTAALEALTGGSALPLWMLVEALGASIVIAAMQNVLLNDTADYTHGVFFGRSVLWLLLSGAVIVATALLFGWFTGKPEWCLIALTLLMLAALTATLVGLKFEQDADTVRLNDDLHRYQEKAK